MKTLTVRLPISVYERAADLAKSRRQSLNRLVQEGLQVIEMQERERLLYEDFTAIAEAAGDEVEVDFALLAQNEVLKDS